MASRGKIKLSEACSHAELATGAQEIHQRVSTDIKQLQADLLKVQLTAVPSAQRLNETAVQLANLAERLPGGGERFMNPGGSSPGGSSPGGSSPGGS